MRSKKTIMKLQLGLSIDLAGLSFLYKDNNYIIPLLPYYGKHKEADNSEKPIRRKVGDQLEKS